jgi:hypothetical protein
MPGEGMRRRFADAFCWFGNTYIAMAIAETSAEKCAICGIRDATGRDHVPPRSIFPRPWPSDLITVPACNECNNRASPNDEEFKVGISIMAGIETPATLELWKAGAMRTLAHNRRLHREVLQRFVKVEVRSEGGIYLGTEQAVLVPKKPVHAVLVRTIRGLYYHHFGECLGARARCDVQRFERGPADSELSKMVLRFPLVSVANGAFRYRYARAEEAPLSSLWFMSFFGSVPAFGYTMDANDEWRPGPGAH